MLIDRALTILCAAEFHCIDIQTNITDFGFNDGITIRNLSEVESRLRVIVPQTNGLAMVIGKGDLRLMLTKLANRIRRGTIYRLPILKYVHPTDAWRTLELDKMYLFLADNITRKDFPILNEYLLIYGDGSYVDKDGDEDEDVPENSSGASNIEQSE